MTMYGSDRQAALQGEPWRVLNDLGRGYLSFYYSEPLAKYAVREVTRRADNKSDPNIETATYGLFSTCEPGMRNRIICDGAATVFFVTRHRKRPRAVTGYYKIGWYTLGARDSASKDWALAASDARFVNPVALSELADDIPECGGAFRTQRPLSVESVGMLKAFIDNRADLTSEYIEELHRVERFARSRTGLMYPSWGREIGFSWANSPEFLAAVPVAGGSPNSSPTGGWLCSECRAIIQNAALLRQCPVCKVIGTLSPFSVGEVHA